MTTAPALSDARRLALIEAATAARRHAYAPYSEFHVGAALLSEDGRIFVGCNVESIAFSPTNCAERTAFFSAVAAGVRRFLAIAVVGGPAATPEGAALHCSPCGVCRQVMAEFCEPDAFEILCATRLGAPDAYRSYSLGELLPHAFDHEAAPSLAQPTED